MCTCLFDWPSKTYATVEIYYIVISYAVEASLTMPSVFFFVAWAAVRLFMFFNMTSCFWLACLLMASCKSFPFVGKYIPDVH